MSQISIIPKYEERNGLSNSGPVLKIYTIGGIEVEGEISSFSVAPLRILTYLLGQKGIEFQVQTNNNNPWEITQILLDEEYAKYAAVALEEIMEYRCAHELAFDYGEIIRQLPFEVAMKTSQNIMNFGKSKKEHDDDLRISSLKWGEYNMLFGKHTCENPNGTIDNITIPEDKKILRKHLIYESSRGGYNIKTRGYSDSSLDHHCYFDSRKWD